MAEVKSMRSEALDLLRFPLALVIVGIHVLDFRGFQIDGVTIDTSGYGILQFMYNLKAALFKDQSVPIYFFISGYVFFLGGNLNANKFKKKFNNRFKSLFIPYVSWNFLALFLMLLATLPMNVYADQTAKELDFSVEAILNTLWNANRGVINNGSSAVVPQDFAMWFVRDLIIIVLTTPLIYFIIKRAKGYAIFAFGIVWLYCWFFESMFWKQMSAGYFFFSLGAFFSINGRDMILDLKKFKIISFILYPLICMALLLSLEFEQTYYPTLKCLNILCGLFFAFNIAVYLIEKRNVKANSFLAASSFFIYAGHPLFLPPVQKIVFAVLRPMSESVLLLALAVTFVATILVLVGAFYITNKSKLLTCLFIGRHYSGKHRVSMTPVITETAH